MIAREWKCVCPARHRDGFLAYLYETGVKETSATPGFQGAQILERAFESGVEMSLVTYWDCLDSIEAFAGEDISVAKLYPEDAKYDIIPDTEVKHYRVVDRIECP